MKKSLSLFFIILLSIIFAQDTTKQISINLPSGIDIDLKGKVEFEFVDVEGEGGATNSTEFIQKIQTRSPYVRIDKAVLNFKILYSKNENLISARNIYDQLYVDSMNSNLGRDSRSIINSEIIENIIRINIQLDDFEEGKKFINSLEQNQRNYELEGDFYKYFKKFDEANNSYDKALEEETDEGKVNFIRLKKVYSND